jgi:hypothetical protein
MRGRKERAELPTDVGDGMDAGPVAQELRRLAAEGLIVNSGRRAWSERTKSWQVIWVATEADEAELAIKH